MFRMTMFCLICCNGKGLKPLDDLFFINKTHTDAIFECFNIQFLDSDSSNRICKRCIARLKYCCTFRRDVEKAHRRIYHDREKNTTSEISDLISSLGYESIKAESKEDNMILCEIIQPESSEGAIMYGIYPQPSGDANNDKMLPQISTDLEMNYLSEPPDQTESCDEVVPGADSKAQTEDESYASDWSVDTQDILVATGFWKELEMTKNKTNGVSGLTTPKLPANTRQCPICLQVFSLRNNLVHHYGTHFPKLLCEICGKPYSNPSGLSLHLLTHKSIKFECPTCHKLYPSNQEMLLHHKRIHEGIGMYKCHVCQERFTRSEFRRSHLVSAHNLVKKRKQCLLCDYYINNNTDYRDHLKLQHYNEWNLKCIECNLIFLVKSHQRKHMEIHSEETRVKYPCTFCEKSFFGKWHLKEHMKIHLNIKQYVCNECDKAFVQKASLQSHMNVHFKGPRTIR